MPQLVFTVSLKSLDNNRFMCQMKAPTKLIPRGKTLAPYRINYMDGHVHSHSMPWGLKEREIFFGRNIWSPLKGRKFVAAERLHLRAQGIAAVFASRRHAVTGTRGWTAVEEGANSSSDTATYHKLTTWCLSGHRCFNQFFVPKSLRSFTPHTHSCPVTPCPIQACPSLVGHFMWLQAEVIAAPPHTHTPTSHPTEISKLKRPKGDINSWHPGPGELT